MENKNMTKEQKCSITQKGRIVIHKDNQEKRVYKEELDTYLSQGWEKGFSKNRKDKLSKSHKGKQTWNKGIPCREETKQKLSQSLKGRPTWQKGLKASEDERVARLIESSKKARLEKYGTLFPNNPMTEERKRKIGQANKGKPCKYKGKKKDKTIGEKISKSKLGHSVSQETKDKISKTKQGVRLPKEKLKQKTEKQYLTRKKNNTFNNSSIEENLYKELLNKYQGKTIYRQYKDKVRYPYYCDFYIVEDDLFIELNAHWSHGGHPFDPSNKEDIEKLKEWQEKAKVSQFYKNAIETWTIRDVAKQKCAKENNLNYIVIY